MAEPADVNLSDYIGEIPDFPKPGILFRDITPLLACPRAFRQAVRQLADRVRDGVHWLVEHPQWPLSAALILVVLRPRRALRWATFAWQGYSLYRRVQRGLPRPRSPRH